jgi:2-amino-4-hydroxy-6-hydroxymethyldihydropteridine diphosphokinase
MSKSGYLDDRRQLTYIGLGSNLGNRFDHLQKAVDLLFEEVGAIRRISAVYETPALGFKGADFLNCVVLVSTALSPAKLINKVLSIEQGMGRSRKKEAAYESRPIDIDILFYGDQVIDRKKLKVPHPHLPNRRFVLQPLCELAPDLVHPVLGQPMSRLLENTTDNSPVTRIPKWLRNPQDRLKLPDARYIVVEGNIGAGKTSLATLMAQDFNAKLVLERFMENPFLPKFYKDPHRFSFPLEMSFLADRYQQLLDGITQHDLFNDVVIADYDFYKSLIFAGITLGEEEYALYQKLFKLMQRELPGPDLYIYLHQDTERLLANIKRRGRSFEKTIDRNYLARIDRGYREFVKTQKQYDIRLIDITSLDFVERREDYLSVLRQILQD